MLKNYKEYTCLTEWSRKHILELKQILYDYNFQLKWTCPSNINVIICTEVYSDIHPINAHEWNDKI